jgi:hypothetical protein
VGRDSKKQKREGQIQVRFETDIVSEAETSDWHTSATVEDLRRDSRIVHDADRSTLAFLSSLSSKLGYFL